MRSSVGDRTLAEICSDVSYGYTESATTAAVGPKFLRITDIQGGTFNWLDVPYCKATEADCKKYALQVGDIVIARTGNSTGENAQVFFPPPPAVFASYLIRFRPNPADINPFFAGYQLRSEKFKQYVLSVRGGSAQPGANAKQLGAFPVQVIDRRSQDAAVAVLRSIDERIALLRETNTTLEAIAQALFKSWFVDFDPVRAKLAGRAPEGMDEATATLFPDSFEDSEVGEAPRGWQRVVLGDLIELTKGCSYKGDGLSETDGAHMFNLGCFNAHRVFATDRVKRYVGEYRARHAVVGGDLILANTDMTQSRDILGRPAFVPDGFSPGFISHHVFKVSVRAPFAGSADAVRRFLFFALQQNSFRERAIGFATGTTVLALPAAAVLESPGCLPPERVLGAFDDVVGPMLERLLKNERVSQTLASLRDTLLPRLISGQLRLPEAQNMAREGLA